MSRETATLNSTGTDYDAVNAQMAELSATMARLAEHLKTATGARTHTFAKDVSEGMGEAASYLGRKGQSAERRMEGAVAANPYIALGLAAGIGLLLGAFVRR